MVKGKKHCVISAREGSISLVENRGDAPRDYPGQHTAPAWRGRWWSTKWRWQLLASSSGWPSAVVGGTGNRPFWKMTTDFCGTCFSLSPPQSTKVTPSIRPVFSQRFDQQFGQCYFHVNWPLRQPTFIYCDWKGVYAWGMGCIGSIRGFT